MSFTRREALAGLAAAALLRPGRAGAGGADAPDAAAAPVPTLTARPATAQLAPAEAPPTAVWAYDGRVPGPVLRARQGDRLARRFVNALPEPSTIHWHGLRLPNAMDGVPGMTQDPVRPGDAFLYDFALKDAGTYWYHPHSRAYEQADRGLAGALVVQEAEGPDVDADHVLLLDDWRLGPEAQLVEDFDNLHDRAHAGRYGNWITVNGTGAWTGAAASGDRLRLRLVNAANARIFSLAVQGLEGWVVALDGMPLAAPAPLSRLALAPAQRVDLVVDVTAAAGEEAFLVSLERDGGYAVATLAVGPAQRARRAGAPAPLPPNPVPAPGDRGAARKAELLMEGGAMGRMQTARMGGAARPLRALAQEGKVWAFNGQVDMPDAPLLTARTGETVEIAIRNETAFPHAMHLHGHHFRKALGAAGLGPLRDTLLVDRGETARIVFVADNPGDWLLHCHMLDHSAGGMMTWLRVG
ncbi:multicopper oxidase family protein [Rhodovulum sp. DZ06]|uniref:multicopper oxidase family protein n=1 Tax=Rhodovulum sp. DZ06 TaxID=3425126 RepID=UPI003D32C934